MTLSDIFLGLRIAYEDGPDIRAFVDELNTNPKCVKGITAIEHALNAYHSGSDGNKEISSPPPVDLHAVIKTLQQHVDAGPQQGSSGNPDAGDAGSNNASV